MTWNLWWRFGEWRRRYDGIIQVLRSSAPDIVGLQEVGTAAARAVPAREGFPDPSI